ncbi:FG-GAP repeat protein, partial [candidate division WOR-3 bacterium]|nr:FG-GAP repeat protein [candidate division WOR-3 bacterium]
YGSSSGLSDSADWIGDSDQLGACYGESVSSAGDVNGDGYSDIIIGANNYDNGQNNEGAAFVYYGSISGLSDSADWMGESNQASAHYGKSVSSAGDVNGDGYSDIIIGALYYSNGETNEGAAFVYYGGNTGLSLTADWMGESNQIDAYYGESVSSAGDVNGDGYSDILVGASYYDNGEVDEGAAFVYYGSSSGLSGSADWMGESNQASAHYGKSVSSAGDVNGDGYSDVIVGAYLYDNGQSNEGTAFVYYGGNTGLSLTADWIGESDQAVAYYGYSVSSAGDVNGDGYSDIIIGSFLYDNGQSNEGAAFVYHGSSSGLSITADWIGERDQASARYGSSVSSAGDVNGDGYSDIIVGAYYYDNGQSNEGAAFVYYGGSSGLSDSANWMGESDQTSSIYGGNVSSADDVNGDGYSDIIVGAYCYDNGESDEGAAFVYYGGSSGLSDSADWMGESNQVGAFYGVSVSSGDVNGDGYSDIIIGAYLYDNGETDEGAAFVYYGSSSGLSIVADWIGDNNQANSQYGVNVSSAGDVNGDGYSDIIIGAYLYDNGETDEGAAFVYYGSSSGLSITADWIGESNQAYACLGNSVASAGDVNGDGYSDIIIGAYCYDNGESDEGAAFVYYGNEGGLSYKPIQMRNDETALIVAPLKSYSVDGFKIGLTGRNYMGIDNVKLEWEVKALGIPFDGTGLTESVSWYTTELNGINIIEQVDGLSNDTYYKWRVRIKYDMAKGILQPYSRWFYIPDNAPGEIDVKTGVYTGIREKRVSIDKNNRLLDFSIYKDIKLLNGEIQEKGLTIYTIDGRKLSRIIVVGQYCIVNEIDNKIINSDKIIVIK